MSVLMVLKTCQMLVLICSSILLVSFVKGVDVMLCAIVILSLSLSIFGWWMSYWQGYGFHYFDHTRTVFYGQWYSTMRLSNQV